MFGQSSVVWASIPRALRASPRPHHKTTKDLRISSGPPSLRSFAFTRSRLHFSSTWSCAPGTMLLKRRATYAGSVLFHVGFGCYLWMMVVSILRFRRRAQGSTARRILLPYAVTTLVINTVFGIIAICGEAPQKGHYAYQSESWSCTATDVLYRLSLSIFILLNDALFLYRTSVLYEWKTWPLAAPMLLYITVFALSIVSNLTCTGIPMYATDPSSCSLYLLIPTALLNVLLTCMITAKLLQARARGGAAAAQCVSALNIVVESACAWVVAILLELLSDRVARLANFAQFFDCLFQVVSLLSPAILLYRIALSMQYTPPAVPQSGGLWRTTSAWLYDVEKQMVHADMIRRSATSESQEFLVSPTPIYNQYSVAPALPPKDARPAIAPLARLQTTNRTTVVEVRPL